MRSTALAFTSLRQNAPDEVIDELLHLVPSAASRDRGQERDLRFLVGVEAELEFHRRPRQAHAVQEPIRTLNKNKSQKRNVRVAARDRSVQIEYGDSGRRSTGDRGSSRDAKVKCKLQTKLPRNVQPVVIICASEGAKPVNSITKVNSTALRPSMRRVVAA